MKLSCFAACSDYVNNFMMKAPSYKELCQRAKNDGMDGIEYVMNPNDFDMDAFRSALEETKMGISLIQAGYLVNNMNLALIHPDKEIEKRTMVELKKVIKNSAELGAGVNIGVLIGRALPDIPTRQNERILVDRFKEIAEYCEKVNGFFTYETYDKRIVDFAIGTETALDIIEKVGSDRCKLVIDFEHMYIEDKDLLTSIMQTREHIAVVHCIDSDHNPCGSSNGRVDFRQAIDALKLINYDGYLVTNLVRSNVEPEKAKDEGLKITSKYIRNLL